MSMLSGGPARCTTSHSLMSSAIPGPTNSGSVVAAVQLPSGPTRLGTPSARIGRLGGSVLNSNLGALGRTSSTVGVLKPPQAATHAAMARTENPRRQSNTDTKRSSLVPPRREFAIAWPPHQPARADDFASHRHPLQL